MVNPALDSLLEQIDSAAPVPSSDLERAEEFISTHGQDLRFLIDRSQWMHQMSNGIWEIHGGGDLSTASKVADCVKAWASRLQTQAARMEPSEAKALLKESRQIQSRKVITDIVALSKSVQGVRVLDRQLDSNPYLLGTKSGVLDLTTGQILSGQIDDYITRQTDVHFEPDAKCPTFEKFLSAMLREDMGQITLMTQWLGYLLTGDVSEQKFMILHGHRGRNGKSVLFDALQSIMGTYLSSIDKRLLTTHDNRAPFSLSVVDGARIVLASETSREARLNTEFIKSFTAGDVMFAERKGTQGYNFRPRAKLMYAVNRMPSADFDSSFKSRVIPVPLNQSFYDCFDPEYRDGDMKPDKDLPAKLRAEASGILNFMIQGFNVWRETGLIIPPSIQEHVLEFESQNDSVGDWLAEMCEINTERKTRSSELFQSYTDYCKRLRIARALKRQEFKARLEVEPGIELRHHGNVPTWKGIGLIEESNDFSGVYRG